LEGVGKTSNPRTASSFVWMHRSKFRIPEAIIANPRRSITMTIHSIEESPTRTPIHVVFATNAAPITRTPMPSPENVGGEKCFPHA
jgi:hypothetical protein